VLVGPESISKKIAVPFLEPLRAQQPFDIELHCRLPSSCKLGLHYYTSTLSFDQEAVDICTVHLAFVGLKPNGCGSMNAILPASATGEDLAPRARWPRTERISGCGARLERAIGEIYLFRRADAHSRVLRERFQPRSNGLAVQLGKTTVNWKQRTLRFLHLVLAIENPPV